MDTTHPKDLAAVLARFVSVWSSSATADHAAPALTCMELDALLELFVTVGALDAAAEWMDAHTVNEPECEGHFVPGTPPNRPTMPL
ncbi:hypothetical protein [Streptomyces sp. NPDC015350]|uniref:hypothetical protein n=1 Tax=Streptomyces sp. NPDC015350 TaxID=3364955 RepID=UPI0036F60A42